MSIGARIKQLRTSAEETQDTLAEVLGITREMVSQYERDEVKDWPLSRLRQIADHYNKSYPGQGINLWWVISGEHVGHMTKSVDMDLLENVTAAVVATLERKSIRLDPRRLAKLIRHIYEDNFHKNKERISGTDVERLLRLVV